MTDLLSQPFSLPPAGLPSTSVGGDAEMARLRGQERDLAALLDCYTPQAFNYHCALPGMEMAGFSLAYDGHRGGDLAFPILFPAPEDQGRYRLSEHGIGSQAIVHPLKSGPSRMGLFLADPTGHRLVDGVVASMLYFAARVAVEYELREKNDVGATLPRTLNTVFYRGEPSPRPIALSLARFEHDAADPLPLKLSYVLAGMPPPLIFRPGESQFDSVDLAKLHLSAPIGVLPTELEHDVNAYRPNRLRLAKGDLIMFYSDGLVDLGKNAGLPYFTRGTSGNPSSVERSLAGIISQPASVIAEHLLESILSHSLEREDDITVYVVKAV